MKNTYCLGRHSDLFWTGLKGSVKLSRVTWLHFWLHLLQLALYTFSCAPEFFEHIYDMWQTSRDSILEIRLSRRVTIYFKILTWVISWVNSSICFSSFIESSNVGFKRCLFCNVVSSFICVWICDMVYWASSKLSDQSGGIHKCVFRDLDPEAPSSWLTSETLSDNV